MSLREADNGAVELVGDCGLDDAEPLLRALLADAAAVVDLRRCERVHAAVAQVLLASGAAVQGPAAGQFLRQAVEPLFERR